jgi:hypothetical protein
MRFAASGGKGGKQAGKSEVAGRDILLFGWDDAHG